MRADEMPQQQHTNYAQSMTFAPASTKAQACGYGVGPFFRVWRCDAPRRTAHAGYAVTLSVLPTEPIA